MRVLLLSAYDAASHQRWRTVLEEGMPDWDWTVLTLPPRHFAWRVRGNPLSWYQHAQLQGSYDLLLATSMVDLATLRGLVPGLASVPSALYFHENQFAYPESRGEHGVLEAQMVGIYAALSAERVLFNSAYNRDSFLAGCKALLKRLPDQVPDGLPEILCDKSEVLPVPVPVPVDRLSGKRRAGESLELLWNHRWEYDKGPEQLLEISRALVNAGVKFRLNVAGQQFRERPAAFDSLETVLRQHDALGQWGFLQSRDEYGALLSASDVVLSTALHDFQGLSVIEAVRLGASPVVPDRLVYPEWLDADYRYADTDSAVELIGQLALRKQNGEALPVPDLSYFDPENLIPLYRSALESVVA